MSELGEVAKPAFWKRYGLWIGVGLIAFYFIYKYLGAGSSGSSTASQYAAMLNAQNAYSAQAGQYALQQNAQQMAYTEQTNQLNAQLQATQMQETVAGVQAAGQTISGIIGAESALPATAINAAAAQNEAALQSAAGVAAAGLSAVPGSVQGAAEAINATTQPWDAVAQAVVGSTGGQAWNSLASSLNA